VARTKTRSWLAIAADDGANSVDGGIGDDVITAGVGADTLTGGNGSDNIAANDGNNIVNGGEGDDSVTAGANNDTVNGGDGADTIAAGTGTNVVDGGTGADVIGVTGAGVLTATGGDGNDSITGGSTADTLSGQADNDTITGLAGNDSISAGAGSDVVTGGTGKDVMDGGAGSDTFIFAVADSGSVAGSIDAITNWDSSDKLDFALGGASVGANYTELAVHADFASALADAGTEITTNGQDYVVIQIGSDTYVFTGAAAVEDVVVLVGKTTADISDANII
jgi:Ca2+-binding RTX toxin-like protein